VVVTLGGDGALVVDGVAAERIPARAVEPVDTTGAGDTFSGALACELSGGAPLLEAVRFAGAAAGLSTETPGARSAPERSRIALGH
jgi:ribokinase